MVRKQHDTASGFAEEIYRFKPLEKVVDGDKLGQFLINKGIITQTECQIGVSEQSVTGERLGEVLIRLGFCGRHHVVAALAQINPEALIGETQEDVAVPRDFLLATQTLILLSTDRDLYFATLSEDPYSVSEELTKFTRGRKSVVQAPFPAMSIREEMEKLKQVRDVQYIADDEEDINKIIKALISTSLTSGASDIHIDSSEQSVHIRLRVDGIVHLQKVLPMKLAGRLLSRIKDRSGMDVSENRRPQDGSFSELYNGRTVDFRVASVPTGDGEKLTLRVLDKEKAILDIDDIGITMIDDWKKLTTWSNGLVLVCGATGSGKTTTLYSTVKSMDKLEKTIFSLEDPIEYRLPFINQIQINRAVGLDFAAGLKTLLRHDPDIVIVGEIRDVETAQNAVRLADTGHLVLATLHTNDVISSLSRLEGLDIDFPLMASLLRGIMVQKLVRTICPVCHGTKMDGGRDCQHCHQTGYRGRTLISELCSFASEQDVVDVRRGKRGYHTFVDDAVVKLGVGATDFPEISRVLGVELAKSVEQRMGETKCIA